MNSVQNKRTQLGRSDGMAGFTADEGNAISGEQERGIMAQERKLSTAEPLIVRAGMSSGNIDDSEPLVKFEDTNK